MEIDSIGLFDGLQLGFNFCVKRVLFLFCERLIEDDDDLFIRPLFPSHEKMP